MEEINIKYKNFISFLENIGLDKNEYVQQLKKYDGKIFILGFKKRLFDLNLLDMDENEAIENIYQEILKKSAINKEFKNENIIKFKRYINYFYLICKTVI